jgi:hypothetical protein
MYGLVGEGVKALTGKNRLPQNPYNKGVANLQEASKIMTMGGTFRPAILGMKVQWLLHG